jgi:hypothetical protein
MGWAVLHNSFGAETPIIQDGLIVNDEFYSEDLLSIAKVAYTSNGWSIDQNDYLIDLGWYPESDPNGNYRLCLIRGSWDNIILNFESTDCKKIRKAIERCFDLILNGIDDNDIPSFFSNLDLV